MKTHDLNKYLRRGFVQECEPHKPLNPIRHFVVIPVFNELNSLGLTLKSLSVTLKEEDAVLLVINHNTKATKEEIDNNSITLKLLRSNDTKLITSLIPGTNLFWIDAGKMSKGGVGEARRIGLDTALSLLPNKNLNDNILISLDADSLVAENYIEVIDQFFKKNTDCGSVSIGVRHQTADSPEKEEAIRNYESYMAEYVDNLKKAGSPYAYHTIGSAIACRATTYIYAGGMRVREAGEDFYFLQALRKVAQVGEITTPIVFPESRFSRRVPFGTGNAIRDQIEGESLPKFSPQRFLQLKNLLDLATEENLHNFDCFWAKVEPDVKDFLESINFHNKWAKVLQNLPKREGAAEEEFHKIFDALKTLQFVRIRD